MSDVFNEVLQTALTLAEDERVQLVDALIGTLEPENAAPLEDAWLAEIARRSREFDDGAAQPIPWHEVRARARQRAQRHG